MAKRLGIESEIRRCEAELKGLMGTAKTFVGAKDPFVKPENDVLTADSVSLYFGESHIQKNVKVTWEDPSVMRGPGVGGDRDPTGAVNALGACNAFNLWRYNLDGKFLNARDYEIEGVKISGIKYFGAKVGFVLFDFLIKFKKLKSKEGEAPVYEWNYVPGTVFCRGGAVGLLVILEAAKTGQEYSVLVNQPRIAAGTSSFFEIPAGMMDTNNNFASVAAKELHEETGIEVDAKKFVDLTADFFGDLEHNGIHPSVGGCDEVLRFFVYKTVMPDAEIKALEGKCTGEFEEGESIKVKIVKLKDLGTAAPDMKTLTVLYLYDQYKKKHPPVVPSLKRQASGRDDGWCEERGGQRDERMYDWEAPNSEQSQRIRRGEEAARRGEYADSRPDNSGTLPGSYVPRNSRNGDRARHPGGEGEY
jgi:8-oxo-dGTP pyrophosphatase MutT (NUDIX family)